MGRKQEFEGGREVNITDAAEARGRAPKVIAEQFLPPDEEGHRRMMGLIDAHQQDVRNDKAQAARESDQQDKAKASKFGLGGNRALRRHLADKHELYEDDAKEMERPAHFHRQWHTMGEYNPDGHTH